jgi:putative ATP-dependent endonuclease of the OLD family
MTNHYNPYISRVQIKNFRNFLDLDVKLNHKQVILGENNIGKTNFLRAIQLILDRDFSDQDRTLTEKDFHDSLEDPMVNGDEIEITLQIRGYEHSTKLLAQFADAAVDSNPPTLQFRYRFFPERNDKDQIIRYTYEIYKGNGDIKKFSHADRNYINIHVIRALRDVERELRPGKGSTLYQLVKTYDISKEDLDEISEEMQGAADKILELDEIVHIKEALQSRFNMLSGLQADTEISLQTFDVDTERLLYALQVYMGLEKRPISELSLGLANILYISLMLLLLKDRTVTPVLKAERYAELEVLEGAGVLLASYEKSESGKFILKDQIDSEQYKALYEFMDENNYKFQAFTILAVEEPEAHLHPLLQRLIYREVLHKSGTSVIFTSHSTFITSVSPLNYIVHIRKVDDGSKAFSTVELELSDWEKKDIERYVDAKRGEIYFGKLIILVEGIAEEYIIPAATDAIGTPLDDYGIIVCNVNSTNFKPYIQLLETLKIPWVLFTDGDYYRKVTVMVDGTPKLKREYHRMHDEGDDFGYGGNENVGTILKNVGIITESPDAITDQNTVFREHGCFVGAYTMEVDMFEKMDPDNLAKIKEIYKELTKGGVRKLKNFNDALDGGDYWGALSKIEANISKGRFAQRLASEINVNMVPEYIYTGITRAIEIVKEQYE